MSDINYEDVIGKNIKKERCNKGWSQNELGTRCQIANTLISAYENGRKKPGLNSIVRIANELGVSIERLCYGDESEAFINTAPNTGRVIVNCVHTLWKNRVIDYYEYYSFDAIAQPSSRERAGFYLNVLSFGDQIKRLIKQLKDFEDKKNTFPDPEMYLENILSSVANEINDIIHADDEKESPKSNAGKNKKTITAN